MTDNLLTAFGVVLSIVGIVLFVRTKAAGDNSMQVLGLHVKVSHPSLLIFFAGILLILVPRLLPGGEQPPAAEQGEPTAEEGVVAEVADPNAEQAEPEPAEPGDLPGEEPAAEIAPDEPTAPDEPGVEEAEEAAP